MIEYPCGVIEDLIPLYIEDDVSDETKEIVENHVKDCTSCTTLLQDYLNDELKLDSFKEDLPQANTFKKLMKKLKKWGLITTAVAVVVAIVIGVVGYKIGEKRKTDIWSLKTIVKTFEKQGVTLKEDSSKSPDEYELNGTRPSVFSIGEKRGTLLVYIFKSFVEREDTVIRINEFSFTEIPFNAKNAYLVYMPSEIPETVEGMKNISETRVLISDVVFKYLNDGKEISYKGESTNWEGTFTLKYYEHFWEDEKGKICYESNNEQWPLIKYKMADISSVGSINLEYETPAGGGSQTGMKLNKDGYSQSGKSGGNGMIPREDEEITLKVKWNGKEETIILKAK
jgi:hypothetical protein